MVEATPSLSRISLVGNSLGGLYVRYAARVLYRDDEGNVNGMSAAAATGSATTATNMTDTNKAIAASVSDEALLVNGGSGSGSDRGEGGAAGGTVAGLKPSVFMTIASPHLGVRRFTYVPLPAPLQPLAGVFVGKTGSDLFLSGDKKQREGRVSSSRRGRRDDSSARATLTTASSTTSEMSTAGDTLTGLEIDADNNGGGDIVGADDVVRRHDENEGAIDGWNRRRHGSLLYRMATSEEFLRPLKAFRRRRAYANRRGDFMVPYGTAAFVEPGEGDGSEPCAPDRQRGTEVEGFTFADQVFGAQHGAVVGVSRVPAVVRPGGGSGGFDGQDRREEERGGKDSVPMVRAGRTVVFARRRSARKGRTMEEEMAAGLNSCGWEKVRVVLLLLYYLL